MPKRFRGGILQARLPEINTSTNFVSDGIYNTADAAQYIGTGNWAGSLQYQQYGTPGTYSFIVPDGVNTISVLAVGAGGAGDDGNAGDGGGGGGAGGACAVASNVAVIPGNTITVVVGTGGASGQGKGVKAENGSNTTVTVGNAIPSNGYSVLFDGSGDYLTISDNAALQMGSGNFTVEYWWYPNSIVGYQTPYDKGYTGAGGLLLQTGNGDGRTIVYASGSAVVTSNTTLIANSWTHMALVRNGTNLTLYQNGISVGSATNSTNFNNANTAGIGGNATGASSAGQYPINGYISNLRSVKGTAVYTSAFTPPAAPLTAIANTSLLTCQSNRFIDNSTNNFTINVVGDSSVSSASPFTSSSVLFDGTGDYLNTSNNAAFTLGTGDLTLECWIYQTATSTSTYRVIFGDNVYGSTGGYTLYSYNNALNLWKGSGGGGAEVIAPAGTITLNTWTHVAWTRSGSSNRLFINGIQVGATTTDSTNYTSTASFIGASQSGTLAFAGYISNARILKGTALYTANFTPPTSSLTNIANTSLLTCQSSRFIDNSTNNFTITVNGNSAVSSVSPFAFIIDAAGGRGGAPYSANPGANGANAVFSSIPVGVVTAGYIGGNGGGAFDGGGGGGGAAGAAGAGGTGSHSSNQTATEAPTNSYAGGGGGARSSAGIGSLGGASGGTGQTNITGGGGGGAYTFTSVAAFLDTNGSNGNGLTTSGSKGGNGGFPGGGGGGSFDGGVGVASSGGNGFVRIVWGTNSSGIRRFPDNALDIQEIR